MALKTQVKVGKITNLSDARYCAGMGVHLLGFPVQTDSGIDLKNYQDITAWISGPALVIEWNHSQISSDFSELVNRYKADYLEVNANLLEKIPVVRCPLIVVLDKNEWHRYEAVLGTHRNRISYLLLVSSDNAKPDQNLIAEIGKAHPVLLGYCVTADNLNEILALPVAGIALEGTHEDSPGSKDYSSLADVLEALETPDL